MAEKRSASYTYNKVREIASTTFVILQLEETPYLIHEVTVSFPSPFYKKITFSKLGTTKPTMVLDVMIRPPKWMEKSMRWNLY